jgi:hypothetical protein
MGIAHAHSSVFSHLSRFRKHWKSKTHPAALALRFACSGRRRSWATSTLDLLSPSVVMAQKAWSKRWIKPEIFPLFAAMGAALGICGFAIARNIAINPDVRISKEDRAAGILDNYKEGKTYKDHGLREYLKDCSPEIMPVLNRYFSTSK